MAKKPLDPLHPLIDIPQELDDHLCKVIAEYKGQATVLESAIGAIVLGQHYGMDVVRMAHSPATLRKYQKILNIKYKDYCPNETHLSGKSVGVKIAKSLGGAWKVITGKVKVEGKGDVTETAE